LIEYGKVDVLISQLMIIHEISQNLKIEIDKRMEISIWSFPVVGRNGCQFKVCVCAGRGARRRARRSELFSPDRARQRAR